MYYKNNDKKTEDMSTIKNITILINSFVFQSLITNHFLFKSKFVKNDLQSKKSKSSYDVYKQKSLRKIT